MSLSRRLLWLRPISPITGVSLLFPETRYIACSDPHCFPIFTLVLLDGPDLPYLTLSPVRAVTRFQANCLHRCVQTNHLWEMPRNVNFIWNWIIAESIPIFLLYRMNKYCINSAISNYNPNHRPVVP